MIEFNGWLTICSDSDELDIIAQDKKLIADVENILREFKTQNQLCEIKMINGFVNLFIGGGHNHDNGYSDDLLKILQEICQIASRSFGIIYVRWPEHEIHWNQYKVYQIAKGIITVKDDVYLSPCNPVIED
ncbi:Imm7 family immunity protein [Fluviicola taffensis]|uniref:Imm7 family immunity protein n=1 Tax=Fluviicola taffensis TaxID=191579 RepID=UPI0031379D57